MRRTAWFPWILVAIGPLLLFGTTILLGEVLFWGTPLLQFVPWRLFGFELLLKGIPPLWNPFVGMGAPLLANYQTAFLYPPNWLLPLIGVERGHAVLAAFHLIWAGWGMVVLSRRLGFSPLGQSVSGIAFSLSGYLVSRAWFISIVSAAAWLPWLIWAVEGLIAQITDSKGRKPLLLAVLVLAVVLAFQWMAGHAQMSWYSLVVVLLWAGWRWVSLSGWKELWKPLIAILASLGIAFGISAIQLIPTLEYLWQSHRAGGLPIEYAMTYSFWPWRLTGVLLPDLFGNPAHGDYWGYGNYWEDAIYIGTAAMIASMAAGYWSLRGRGSDPKLGRFLLILSVIALLLALGDNTPLFPFLFKYVPTFGLFQAPTRWNLWLIFSLSLLAGLGIQGWKTPTGRGLFWTRLGTAGAAVIAFAAWVATQWIPDLESSFIRAFTVATPLLVTFGVLTLFAQKDRMNWITLMLGFFLVIDLVYAGWGLNPATSSRLYEGTSDLLREVQPDHRIYISAETEQLLKFDEFFRFDTFYAVDDWRVVRAVGLPNSSMLDDIATANNFDPLVPGRYLEWIEALEMASEPVKERALALMDVASYFDQPHVPPEFRSIDNPAHLRLYDRVEVVRDTDEALKKVMSEDFNPSRDLVIETPAENLPIGGAGVIRSWIREDPNSLKVEVQSQDGTWLFRSEAWYPGWRVRIDDRDTELYHADYLFMSVWIEPGDHIVEFCYEPLSIRVGLVVTLVTLFVTIGLSIRWIRD